MILQPLESPQKLAHYLTDNTRLQAHLIAFLSAKTENERTLLDEKFWNLVETLHIDERNELTQAKKQIAQRMLDRTNSVALFLKEQKMDLGVLA